MATWLVIGVAVIVAALAVWAGFSRDPDKRWLLAMTTAILSSPLGWTHYVPFLAPALVAFARPERWNRMLTASILLLCIPPGLLYSIDSFAGGITIASAYSVALLLLWAGVAITPESVGSAPQVRRANAAVEEAVR